MTKTLTLRNVPDRVVNRLHARARRHGHSMQAELLAIVESSVVDAASLDEQLRVMRASVAQPLTLDEIHDAIDTGRP